MTMVKERYPTYGEMTEASNWSPEIIFSKTLRTKSQYRLGYKD
jgi:hypothetical protein